MSVAPSQLQQPKMSPHIVKYTLGRGQNDPWLRTMAPNEPRKQERFWITHTWTQLCQTAFRMFFCSSGVTLLPPVGDPQHISTPYPTDLNFCHYRLWVACPHFRGFGGSPRALEQNRLPSLLLPTIFTWWLTSHWMAARLNAFLSTHSRPCLETRLPSLFKGKDILCKACPRGALFEYIALSIRLASKSKVCLVEEFKENEPRVKPSFLSR